MITQLHLQCQVDNLDTVEEGMDVLLMSLKVDMVAWMEQMEVIVSEA